MRYLPVSVAPRPHRMGSAPFPSPGGAPRRLAAVDDGAAGAVAARIPGAAGLGLRRAAVGAAGPRDRCSPIRTGWRRLIDRAHPARTADRRVAATVWWYSVSARAGDARRSPDWSPASRCRAGWRTRRWRSGSTGCRSRRCPRLRGRTRRRSCGRRWPRWCARWPRPGGCASGRCGRSPPTRSPTSCWRSGRALGDVPAATAHAAPLAAAIGAPAAGAALRRRGGGAVHPAGVLLPDRRAAGRARCARRARAGRRPSGRRCWSGPPAGSEQRSSESATVSAAGSTPRPDRSRRPRRLRRRAGRVHRRPAESSPTARRSSSEVACQRGRTSRHRVRPPLDQHDPANEQRERSTCARRHPAPGGVAASTGTRRRGRRVPRRHDLDGRRPWRTSPGAVDHVAGDQHRHGDDEARGGFKLSGGIELARRSSTCRFEVARRSSRPRDAAKCSSCSGCALRGTARASRSGQEEHRVAELVPEVVLGDRRGRRPRPTSSGPATASSSCRWLASGSCRPVISPVTARAGRSGPRTRSVQPLAGARDAVVVGGRLQRPGDRRADGDHPAAGPPACWSPAGR